MDYFGFKENVISAKTNNGKLRVEFKTRDNEHCYELLVTEIKKNMEYDICTVKRALDDDKRRVIDKKIERGLSYQDVEVLLLKYPEIERKSTDDVYCKIWEYVKAIVNCRRKRGYIYVVKTLDDLNISIEQIYLGEEDYNVKIFSPKFELEEKFENVKEDKVFEILSKYKLKKVDLYSEKVIFFGFN